jgi:hypothetical protein
MVGHRHISSNLLTTFLSVVLALTSRELGCLDPTTSAPCLVILVFSEKRIGWVCSSHFFRAPRAELPTAKKPKPASHQPAGRTSPAAGVNEQNLTSIFDLTPGRYGLKERALPFPSRPKLFPAVGCLASTTWRSLGAKIPDRRKDERLEFLGVRREHIATSMTRLNN